MRRMKTLLLIAALAAVWFLWSRPKEAERLRGEVEQSKNAAERYGQSLADGAKKAKEVSAQANEAARKSQEAVQDALKEAQNQ